MNRRDQSRQETRQRLLQTARALFEAEGVEATTTREVARRAGVAVGTVFAHFPDKAALVEAVLVDQIDRALAVGRASLPEGDAAARIAHVCRALYAAYAEHPSISRALIASSLFVAGDDRPSSRQLAEFRAWVLDEVRAERTDGQGVPDDADFMGIFALYFALLVAGLRGDVPPEAQGALIESLIRRWLQGGGR